MNDLNIREQRVVRAFLNCIIHGEYTEDYAITLIEDNARYGWMRNIAKDVFYDELGKLHPQPEPEEEEPGQTEEEGEG